MATKGLRKSPLAAQARANAAAKDAKKAPAKAKKKRTVPLFKAAKRTMTGKKNAGGGGG